MRHTTNTIIGVTAIVISLFSFVSCRKDTVLTGPEASVPVTVGATLVDEVISTRASGDRTSQESQINRIQVFVYKDGELEVAGSKDASSITIHIRKGDNKAIYVVCNAPVIATADADTPSALMATVSSLSDNAIDGFVMRGNTVANIQESVTVPVQVTRIVSKITVDRIIKDPSSTLLAHETLTLRAIYLTDVVGNSTLSASASPSEWLNRLDHEGDLPELTYESLGDVVLSGEHDTCHTLYCYPNNTSSDSVSPTWSPRYTRLVLKVGTSTFSDVYYTVAIPDVGSNKDYHFSYIKLSSLGLETPYGAADQTVMSFHMDTLSSWGSSSNKQQEVI